jgi:hypothetical protein
MVEVSDRILVFAKEAFRKHIQELLDDPSWIYGEAPQYIAEQRLLAKDLDIDFDELVKELGSQFEIIRLTAIEEGII